MVAFAVETAPRSGVIVPVVEIRAVRVIVLDNLVPMRVTVLA